MEMVGVMGTSRLREEAVSYLNDAKMGDTSVKTSMLKRLKEILLHRDPSLLHEFVPHLMELQTEGSGPVRNYLVQMIQEIGLKHPEHIPSMVPVLLALMRDDTPAVARHAISTGSSLFRSTFEQVALQGIYSGLVDTKLQESWGLMTTVKDAMYFASKEHKNDGVRLLAIKFIEMVILLFTPEPTGSTQPPPLPPKSDKIVFNVAWLHGGHPVLDVGSLGQEASKNLSLLLDQLRGPEILKIPGPVAVVLVNSLASVAKQRPSLYGRVLPVLLGLVPHCEAMKGIQVASIAQALKNALGNLLKCTHSGAGPWRDRIVSALKVMKDGDAGEAVRSQTKVDKVHYVDRNRPIQENGIMDEHPGKRFRASPSGVQTGSREGQSDVSSGEIISVHEIDLENESLSLQKLVRRIGALVAKGDQSITSVDHLIGKLSADVLADVVIENMKNLPHMPPAASPRASTEALPGFSFSFGMPFSTLGQTLASSFPAPEVVAPPALSSDHRRDPRRDPRRLDPHLGGLPTDVKLEEPVVDATSSFTDTTMLGADQNLSAPSTDEQISFIPGISQARPNKEARSISSNSLINDVVKSSGINLEGPRIQNIAISLSTRALPFSLPMSSASGHSAELVDAMEVAEVKPLIAGVNECAVYNTSVSESRSEVQAVASSGATAQSASTMMPLVSLDVSQQLGLWKVLLVRVLESDKQVGSSGGCELRLSILARFLLGSDPGDEAWDVLLRHILADYQNHKGHELVVHTLYHLYAEKLSYKDESKTGSITPSTYDKFFISVAEGLRDALPPTDKSLSRLLGEAPMLPEAALKLLEALCNPGSEIKEGLDAPIVERITQGLSAVWSLILLRPPIRSECLDIALKCTVHELEEVRTKAIRLVANKLYPLSYLSQSIEEFAMKRLLTVLDIGACSSNGTKDLAGDEVLKLPESQSDQGTGKGLRPQTSNSDQIVTNDSSFEDEEQKGSKNLVSVQEAQRCMSLYFALCTKKHSLLREIFNIYERSPKAVKQAVHKHMPVLTRTIGPSPDVLQIISNPPAGSKSLLFLVLHVLTESTAPSSELIAAVKKLYETKIKDAKLLTPILSSLSKEEVLPIFPHLVALPSQDFKGALDRILQGSVHTGPALTPAEVLIAIHGIDPERDHVPLSMVKDACAVCFQQRTVFTQQVLAKVLNQLVEQTPLPMLFMRTVIQAVGSFRPLVSFVMEILSRLVSKQIWKWPNLWIGFLKCAEQTQPHSFHVLLQLPALQLEKALNRHPNLRAPLTKHASNPGVRSTLPRSTLLVLELAQDVMPQEAATSVQSSPVNVSASANNPDTETEVSELPKTS